MMFTQLLFFAVICVSTRAFTLHQDGGVTRHCVDLQCPRAAFESGKQRLLPEEDGKAENCQTCEQCTTTGYSVCMKLPGHQILRAERQKNSCSCAHSVPSACIVKPAHHQESVNESFVTHSVCYLNSLQTPPKPMTSDTEENLLVDVEAFWQEPYWLDFELSNLTLHYKFVTKDPKLCDGEILPAKETASEHYCHGMIKLLMTNNDVPSDQPTEAHLIEYDEYNGYDDRPVIEFDREVFYNAERVAFWITVNVRRPRQLQFNSPESPFVDVLTELPSRELDVELKQVTHVDDHSNQDKTEEQTEDPKNSVEITKMDILNKESELDDHLQIMDQPVEKTTETTEDPEHEDHFEESREEEAKEAEPKKPELTEESESQVDIVSENEYEDVHKNSDLNKDTEETPDSQHDEESSVDAEDDVEDRVAGDGDSQLEKEFNDEVNEENINESRDDQITVEPSREDENVGTSISEEEEQAVVENVIVLTDNVTDDKNITATTENIIEHYMYSSEKELTRMVFFVTIGATLFIIILAFIFKKGWCCGKSKDDGNVTTKTSNGYKYHVAKTQDMVANKERELLNQ